MEKVFVIIIIAVLVAVCIYQLTALIKDIVIKRKNIKNKAKNKPKDIDINLDDSSI